MEAKVKNAVETCRQWYWALCAMGKGNQKSVQGLLEAAILIENMAAAQPKWISVTEQMPDTGKTVICCASGYMPRVVTGWYDAQHKMWHLDFDVGRIITHWMPLPKPPKAI